jgi:hypothetical protein
MTKHLNKEKVEKAIHETVNEVRSVRVSSKALSKFGTSKMDALFQSYIDGELSLYLKGLPLLIKKLGLKNIVELGNREGVSTVCLWDTLASDANLTTIDIEKDQRFCPEEMFRDPQINFIFGDVCDLEIFKGKIPFDIDFLFSDTIHFNFQIEDEFEVYQHLLADTALVAIDDININDKRLFFDNIHFKKWDVTEQLHGSGFGLFLFERKNPVSREEQIKLAYQASAKIWKRKYDEAQTKLSKIHRKSWGAISKKIVKKIPGFYKIYTNAYNKYHKRRHPNIIKYSPK